MVQRLTDQDPRREQRRQSILLDRLERRFRGGIQAAIKAGMREAIEVYELTGDVPPIRDLQERLEVIYRQLAETSVKVFAARVLDQGKALGLDIERKDFAETFTRIALSYVAQEVVRRRITSIAETTRQQIVDAVAMGYNEGLGTAAIGKRIRDNVQGLTVWRAAMISRTETHGAANYGAQEAARETGLVLRKEWVAASGERTRDDHRRADGQIVNMDEAFDVGGEALMFPGDPAGSAEQVINCRCSVSHIVVD
jgi:uncharacterized protein with gpF-like domain